MESARISGHVHLKTLAYLLVLCEEWRTIYRDYPYAEEFVTCCYLGFVRRCPFALVLSSLLVGLKYSDVMNVGRCNQFSNYVILNFWNSETPKWREKFGDYKGHIYRPYMSRIVCIEIVCRRWKIIQHCIT